MSKKAADGHSTRHVDIPRNFCFGCGADNPDGMRLKFKLDGDGKRFICRFKLSKRYVGPPGHAHGGYGVPRVSRRSLLVSARP